MTSRPLTDDQLAAGLRAHLPLAHPGMHQQIRAEITATPQERRMPSILARLTDADPTARRRMLLLVALLGLALVASAAGIVGALLREQQFPDLSRYRPADVDYSDEVVRGWPDTNHNAPGVYSWDGSTCSSTWCGMSFMHNGMGTGDVDIQISTGPVAPSIADGATSATFAGQDGLHRRIDSMREAWFADIEGMTITIELAAEPGTSQADLADAYGIIASMRTEPQDNPFGFRLVFRLTTDDWDSG